MDAIWLSGADWLAVLRIGLGLWWLESWRHKDKKAWFERGTGIAWAPTSPPNTAGRGPFGLRRDGRATRPRTMAYVVVYAELAVGLGLVVGFLTPIALVGGLLLNVLYFTLMIHDWAEQGQNAMMALISAGGPVRDVLAGVVAGRAGVVLIWMAGGAPRFDLPEPDAFTRPTGRPPHRAACSSAAARTAGGPTTTPASSAPTAGARTSPGSPRAAAPRSTPGPSSTATTCRPSGSGCRTSRRWSISRRGRG
jgi:thiosulfate dehydrogenase [quinone] large subunit